MPEQVLVAYATRAGSTAEVAEGVAQALRDAGVDAVVRKASEVRDVVPYRAVIVGSAIRMGKPLSEAVDFVVRHRAELASKPVAYFAVCLTMKEDSPKNRETVAAYFEGLRQLHEPISLGLFGGKLDFRAISPIWRFFFRMAKSMAVTEGDFRRWDDIRDWTAALVPHLTAPA